MVPGKAVMLRTVRKLLSEADGGPIIPQQVAEELGIDSENEEQLTSLFAVLRTLRPYGIGFDEVQGGSGVIFELH